MSNLFSNIKEKLGGISEESMNTKNDINPRNNKGVTIGASKQSQSQSSAQQANRLFDTSDDICVVRGIQLVEDSGNYMVSVIERLEKGQLVVVDFSESDETNKEIQFHVLWGAVMAFHGTFKLLDKSGNLVIFSGVQNRIAEDRGPISIAK